VTDYITHELNGQYAASFIPQDSVAATFFALQIHGRTAIMAQ
jgi:hypothetical protein